MVTGQGETTQTQVLLDWCNDPISAISNGYQTGCSTCVLDFLGPASKTRKHQLKRLTSQLLLTGVVKYVTTLVLNLFSFTNSCRRSYLWSPDGKHWSLLLLCSVLSLKEGTDHVSLFVWRVRWEIFLTILRDAVLGKRGGPASWDAAQVDQEVLFPS